MVIGICTDKRHAKTKECNGKLIYKKLKCGIGIFFKKFFHYVDPLFCNNIPYYTEIQVIFQYKSQIFYNFFAIDTIAEGKEQP